MPVLACSKKMLSLGSGALLALASLGAVPEGTKLTLPVKGRTIVAPSAYRLNTIDLRPEVEIVILFYSASWCAPCKQAAQALRSAYPEIIAAEPRIEWLSYSLDLSPDARADYLRATQFPWPAIAPEQIGSNKWPTTITGGTPQFQAFIINGPHWQAITAPGDAHATFKQALTRLNKREISPLEPNNSQ
jgi:thiol-disulfide isomerase/thioredoxin